MQSNHGQMQTVPDVSPRRPYSHVNEVLEDRAERLYQAQGGPLIGWLEDEARQRGQSRMELGAALGVTPGYLAHLRSGARDIAGTSGRFIGACAAYLGVPAIVVKFLAGWVRLADFGLPAMPEETEVKRAMGRLLQDTHVRMLLPDDVQNFPLEAQKALLVIYAESSGVDIFSANRIPSMLQYLKPAAVIVAELEARAELALSAGDVVESQSVFQ